MSNFIQVTKLNTSAEKVLVNVSNIQVIYPARVGCLITMSCSNNDINCSETAEELETLLGVNKLK